MTDQLETDNEPDGMLAYVLAIRIQNRDDPSWPLPSFSAVDWAEAFVKSAKDKPDIATDKEIMLAWFANALMRGYDEYAMQHPERSVVAGDEPDR